MILAPDINIQTYLLTLVENERRDNCNLVSCVIAVTRS